MLDRYVIKDLVCEDQLLIEFSLQHRGHAGRDGNQILSIGRHDVARRSYKGHRVIEAQQKD